MPNWGRSDAVDLQESLAEFNGDYNKNITILAEPVIPQLHFVVKRLIDIIFSLVGIILLSPVMICVSLVIRATSKGSTIYKQERVGRGGKLFYIYKFRTMVDGAENLKDHLSPELIDYYKKNRKLNDDPRITKLGRALRRMSIDELPQLVNIIKGNMSIVGPRPMMPEEIDMYGGNYSLYITIKPGLTGLWQILGRDQTMIIERSKLDAEYIKRESLIYDIKIIIKTFGVVLSRKGAC